METTIINNKKYFIVKRYNEFAVQLKDEKGNYINVYYWL